MTLTRSRSLSLLFGLLFTISACSDDDHPGATGAPRALPECPDLDFAPCDTRETECQERLLTIAQCVVGKDDASLVPIHVLSEEQLRSQLEAEAEPPTPDELAHSAIIEGVLVELDLAAKGDFTLEASIENVLESYAGLYRDAERGITLIDRGQRQDGIDANALLVHELVHALQDAEYDLAALTERAGGATDANLALKAIVEGEATWYQYRVVAAMLGFDPEDVNFPRVFGELREELLTEVTETDSGYVASFGTFPYAFGPQLMYDAWVDGGQGFEAALLTNPPRTTLEVMDRSLDRREPVLEPREFSEPTPSEDFTLLDEDSLGAFIFELCFYKKGLSQVGWRGDHLWIYTDADGSVAWLWELEIDGVAADVAPNLELALPSHVSVEGAGNLLFAVSHPERAPFLLDAGRAFLAEAR